MDRLQRVPGGRSAADFDAWGEEDEDVAAPIASGAGCNSFTNVHRPSRTAAPRPTSCGQPVRAGASGVIQTHVDCADPVQAEVVSLQALCMGVLGRCVEQLVDQLGEHLQWLPPEVKASLLAVARRRQVLTDEVLLALVDESWRLLDVSGCAGLHGAALVAAAKQLPNLRALDITGCERVAAGAYRQLARSCPRLEVLRLGGSEACSSPAAAALPHILPRLARPLPGGTAAAGGYSSAGGSREASDDDFPDPESLSVAEEGRLNHLRALLWHDVPRQVEALVWRQCPRVAVNPPPLRRDPRTGLPPPPELDPSRPLDEGCMRGVGPQALHGCPGGLGGGGGRRGGGGGGGGGASLAERFRAAYVDQARRVRERDARLVAQAEAQALRSSSAARVLHDWLDSV